jgi:uncharacterized integral membrane protein
VTTPKKQRPTRISGTWVAVLVAIVLLIFLLVFILQNLTDVTVKFLGIQATMPQGVALLFGAIAGAVTVALVGAARILQLRRQTKKKQEPKAPTVPDESSSPVPPAS